MKQTLTAENLSKSYVQDCGKVTNVLQDISVSFEQGRSYAITGASGSGKSTLMHLLGGLDNPSSGTVKLGEQDIFKMSEDSVNDFRRKTIGFMFQFHYLIGELSVLQNAAISGIIGGIKEDYASRRAKELLCEVGLEKQIDLFPNQLSGGQQQRVALVRAMMNLPSFILADEPTGNLDAENAEKITQLLLRGKEKHGNGLIVCTHDKTVWNRMDEVYHLEGGSLSRC
ncbi:ABC transporter ATP-binding protein [Candidatus Dependentiae bacterium]